MLRNLQIFSFFLLIFPFTANAASVTLQSEWSVHTFNCPACIDGPGVFTLTYDDTTPVHSITGSIPYQRASYLNAITSATFEYGAITWNLDHSVDNFININELNGNGTDASTQLSLLDASHTSWKLSIGFEDYDVTFVTLALNNIVGLDNDDNVVATLRPPGCNTYACGYSFNRQLTPLTPVPIPSTAWLLGSSLLGLAGAARKRKRILD